MAKPPPLPDVHDALTHMRTEYLQCRDFGHSWRPYSALWHAQLNHYESRLRCSRCKAQRVRYIGGHGQLMGGHYEYPDGYLVAGMGRLTGDDRDELRLVSLQHVLPIDTDEG